MNRTRVAIVVFVALAGLAAWSNGQEPASQPTTREAPTRLERLSDLIALVEGPNTPEVRLTIARELLLQDWPETPPRLAGILSGPNGPARVAIATALAERPATLAPAYVEPLVTMLGDPDAAVRQAAAGALAAYRKPEVMARLKQLVFDARQSRPARLAALSALGLMTEREAVAVLATALDDPDGVVVQAALAALGQATAMDFGDDAAAARAWWERSRGLPLETWQQEQIERLIRKDRDTRRRLEAAESRLARVLEAGFLRAAEAERLALLTGYLSDTSTTMRLLGLRLAQLHLAEGKTLPAELQERIRNQTASAEAREQAAAVQTTASFREPADAERFLNMLPTARTREVRLALLNGLGYVGNATAVDVLLTTLNESDEACATEAVAALGRLVERGVLNGPLREGVVTALLGVLERAQAGQVALRERTLWAMGNLADPRCGLAFATAIDRQEPVVVRQAAVRGLAALRSPQWGEVLATASADPDAGVRKTAIETLAAVAHSGSDRQLWALWDRAASAQEPDEALRQTAWRGLIDALAEGPLSDTERWLDRVAVNGGTTAGRVADLLERLIRAAQEAEPVDPVRMGVLRWRLAAQRARLGQSAEAVATYVAALADLSAARSDATPRAATDLLRTALAQGCYDETVAAALANAAGLVDVQTLRQAAQDEIENVLTQGRVDPALAAIAALEGHPPAPGFAGDSGWLEGLRQRAVRQRAPATESAPAALPSSAPAAGPAP